MEKAFWGKTLDQSILRRVHERWKLVLDLIVVGNGTNNLVESHRGLKAKLDDLPEVPDSDNDEVIDAMLRQVENEEAELIDKLCEDIEDM